MSVPDAPGPAPRLSLAERRARTGAFGRRGAGATTQAAGAGWVRAARLWRRSLQFRVVAVTMLMGLIVLTAVGTYLYRQVADGLVEERRVVASAEALQLTRQAQIQFNRTDQVQSQEAISQAAVNVVAAAAGTERSRYVILTRSDNNRNQVVVPTAYSGEVGLASIPPELRKRVSDDASIQQQQIVTIRLTGDPEPVPAWVIGQQVDLPLAGRYGMYLVYPMERERDSLSIVGRTFAGGGLALILLIGGVAYVVTRLVVAPVRRAAAIAERFAAGELNERMPARGEDDLATLAKSFNEMAASLQQQIAQLENLSRLQQRFVSDVSHELRTPLTTIRMAGDLIHDSRDDFAPAVARSAELLHNELDRFEALLADLLEISRFDAGAAALDEEPTDLRRSVEKVVDSCAPLAERKGSPVTVDSPPSGCEAEVDSRRVERIVRNLLVNAIEHGEGRPIEIRIAGNEQAVAVSVRDHGVGLRPGEAAMVFNRFWRADQARARTTGGTGLGLAISLEDARLHAGWLQAWGARGRGSCFRLTLPRSAGARIETSPLPLNPLVHAGREAGGPAGPAGGGPAGGGPAGGAPAARAGTPGASGPADERSGASRPTAGNRT